MTTTTNSNNIQKLTRFQRLVDKLPSYTFIWLSINEADPSHIDAIKEVRNKFSNFKTFEDYNLCEEYIENRNINEKIIVIVTNCELLQKLYDKSKIIAIYVYYDVKTEQESIEKYTQHYPKVKAFLSNLNDLIAKLSKDQRIRVRKEETSTTTINILNRSENNSSTAHEQRDVRNAEFLYFQLFLQSLIKMPRNDKKAKKELIEAWLAYSDNEKERKMIDCFDKEYNPQQAFYWYSKKEFLYSVLNEALRERNINAIFRMRFFIIDLIQELTDEHYKFLTQKGRGNDKLTLYRGQEIFVNELDLLRKSKDEFITFNSFLSTSQEKNVAQAYADVENKPNSKGILYEITIDTRMKTTPFADIKETSHYPDEEEILISAGAIFRIGEVVYDNDQHMWIAKLLLCSEDDYELNSILKFEEGKIRLSDADALGWIFYKQGEYDRAKDFFENLLEELLTINTNLHDIANCYRGLGFVLREMEKYDEALKNHKEELKIRVKMDPTRKHINIATNYIALADVYKWKKRFSKLGFKYLQRAYAIIPPMHSELSHLYNSAADIYQEKKQFDLAIKYYKKSLELCKIYFPENHFEMGVIYRNVGALYSKLGENSEAIHYYEEARGIWLKSSLQSHKKFIELEEAIEARMKAIIDKQFEPYDLKRLS